MQVQARFIFLFLCAPLEWYCVFERCVTEGNLPCLQWTQYASNLMSKKLLSSVEHMQLVQFLEGLKQKGPTNSFVFLYCLPWPFGQRSKLTFSTRISFLPLWVSVFQTQFSELPATALTSKFAFHSCHTTAFQAKGQCFMRPLAINAGVPAATLLK